MISKDLKIILASQSPRRRELLQTIAPHFRSFTKDVDEVYPEHLKSEEIPVFLAKLKASAFDDSISDNEVVITADTVVCLAGDVLGKPKNQEEAANMLQRLSGKSHQVITGVCITSNTQQITFSEVTDVTFKKLSSEEINYYIEEFQPYDKAGGYAIQEWIGMIAISEIKGDYFNVVGLPVFKLYQALLQF